MSNEFTEPSEELKRVAEEIRLLRSELQNAVGSLGRMERRLKVAFPSFPPRPKRQPRGGGNSKHPISTKTPTELQSIFESLVKVIQDNGDSAFAARTDELKNEDIFALAIELGISSPSKLSRRKATEGIRKRAQEAVQLQFQNRANTR